MRRGTGLYDYLDSLGILEKGTEEQIKDAKKTWRRLYMLGYKQGQRKSHGEFTVLFSKKGEYQEIKAASMEHNMTVTRFIKQSALAYAKKIFLAPDREQAAHLERLLMQSCNEIRSLARNKVMQEKFFPLQKRIEALESSLSDHFNNPPPLEDAILKAIEKNPSRREYLLNLIKNAG